MDQPSTSGTSGKRKREVLTLERKLEIIGELRKGATAVSLSERFKVPRTTINDLKKNADEIEKFASEMESLEIGKRRKTMKTATNEKLDEAVYLWFMQKRCEGIPLSGPIICEKAIQFNLLLGGSDENFKASGGWLQKSTRNP